jgi:hypothetical protein
MFRKVLMALGVLALVSVTARSQTITIDGVTDRMTYNDSVTLRVQTNGNFLYEVTLNDSPIAAGIFHTVGKMDYYDLAVHRTDYATSAVTNVLVRFIVLSSQRGAPEKGLIQWLPYPSVPATASEFAGAQMRLIVPESFPKGIEVPIVAWIEDAQGNERRVNGFIAAPGFESSRIKILRGVGSGFVPPQTNAGSINYNAQLHAMTAPKVINIESNTSWTTVSGTLAGATTWADNSRIWLNGNVTIPQGSLLTVGAGTVVRLNPLVTITNLGRIVINGTSNQPVVFTPTNHILPEDAGGAWGGFVMRTNTSELVANFTIFAGGGGANSWSFSPGSSHKSQQPVLFMQFGARVSMTNSAIINSHGQVGNGYQAVMTMDHCLYQRAITSGEYDTCTNIHNHCAIIEFPEESGIMNATIADADYDAFYMIKGTNLFINTLVGFCKDDALDSGSDNSGDSLGSVRVEHCWIESAQHESMAWSGHNRKTFAYNTVSMNSGQGIENGWTDGTSTYANALTTPDCFAERLLSIGNSVGARVGDNYNWAYRGFLRLTNSLVLYNYRNVFLKTWNTSGVLTDTNQWVDRLAQIDLANTVLSAPDPRFPSVPVWNSTTDAPRLAQWMTTPPDASVGIGLALWNSQISAADLTNGIPVRLSSFTTNSVSVDYAIETPSAVVASGTITFTPGETLKNIFGNPAAIGAATTWRVVLRNPNRGELTGTRAAYALPQQQTTAPATLITSGSAWKYIDDGSNQGTAWRNIGFNDNTWSNGVAQLGFGDNDEATRIRRTNNATAGNTMTTFYFRRAFNNTNAAPFADLSMWMLRDDGGVVYINGTEVYRSPTMPPAPATITYTTFANSLGVAPQDNTIDTATLSATLLGLGTNVVAVEIHQFDLASSDLSFDFSLTGNPPMPTRVSSERFGNELVLYWTASGYMLEQADSVTGPWTFVASEGVATVSLGTPQKFFRLRKP